MKRVLVVDDSVLIHKLIKNILESEGYETCPEAMNGAQAIKLSEEYKPDIIIMDINMPVMDGVLATKKIKALNPKADIIFIASTADKFVREQAKKVGVKNIISKPFDKSSFIQVLKNIHKGFKAQEKVQTVNTVVKPFLNAVEEVTQTMMNVDQKVEKQDEKNGFLKTGGFSAVVGLTGQVNGTFLLNMNAVTAWNVAQKINKEVYSDVNDAFIGHSIKELTNIICDKAMENMIQQDSQANISRTSPSMFRGMSMSMLVEGSEAYSGVMKTEYGDINVNLLLN